jgi:hypothetical protein
MVSARSPGATNGGSGTSEQRGPTVELVAAPDLDAEAYSRFQRASFRDLLTRSGVSDAHMTPELYRWKYDPPAGPGRVAVIRDGEEILSSSAMLPLRVSFAGTTTIGWHCVDVATLPEVRRRGYLQATLRALRDSVPATDILFAFPNAGSIGAFLKLGFREHGVVTTWTNPWVRVIARRHPRIEPVDRFEPLRDVVVRGTNFGRVQIDRSTRYLDWRYTGHPFNRYVSFALRDRDRLGVIVVRRASVRNREVVVVMEILGTDTGVRSALLRHAAAWGCTRGIGMMVVMDTGMPVIAAIRSMLAAVPSFLLPKRQVLVVAGGRQNTELSARKWSVQTGDWDVF